MKPNEAVYLNVIKAVCWVAYAAEDRAVDMAVKEAVVMAVSDAVDEDVFWAMYRAVRGAAYHAPTHPALDDFLFDVGSPP